jgi:hypothetical protein
MRLTELKYFSEFAGNETGKISETVQCGNDRRCLETRS